MSPVGGGELASQHVRERNKKVTCRGWPVRSGERDSAGGECIEWWECLESCLEWLSITPEW